MVHYGDFRYGRLDRKVIMRGDLTYRNKGFLESENVLCTDNLTAVPRPGTRLVADFGTNETRVIPFSRGQNEQYLLILQADKQLIYYVDMNGNLAVALADDVAVNLVPTNLEDNVDQGYTISTPDSNPDAYKTLTTAGYSAQDIKDITIEMPTAATIYAINFLQGKADGFTVTMTKSDDSVVVVDAEPESEGSTRYVMPTGYDYTDVVSVRLQAYIYVSPKPSSSGGSTLSRVVTLSGLRLRMPSIAAVASSTTTVSKMYTNCYIKSVRLIGATAGTAAEWTEPMNWPMVQSLDYDQNNQFLFLAHHEMMPYVVSIGGSFSFDAMVPVFPQDYNFTTMGYPSHVACGQSRLWFANMFKEPTTIIASKIGYTIGDFQTFTPQVVNNALMPDSALKFTPIEMKNRIEWILGGDNVALGSWDGTYKMFYGQNGVISATGAAIKQQNEDAASGVKPAWKDGKMIFTGVSRDNLRMMDYNMYVARQESDDISKFHTELMGRVIKKTIIKKDASNDIYILFEDGTAAMAHFYSKEDRGFFPISMGHAKIMDINVVKTNDGDRLYLTCLYEDNTWKLVLMDDMEKPRFPVVKKDKNEYQEDVARWVQTKAPLDLKDYVGTPLTFEPDQPLYVSQIQQFDPAGVSGIIEQYGPYVVFLNNPVNGVTWDDLVGSTLFFEDTDSLYDFYVKVYKVDGFLFGIPSNPDNPHWNNVIMTQGNYNYAFSATNGFVGVEEIKPKYPAKSYHVFSDREYLGEFSGVDDEGNPLSTIPLPKPVACAAFGVDYPIYFHLGNVSANQGLAKRRISLVDFNTFGSWGLSVGTESTSQLVQLFSPDSTYGLIPKAMDTWTHVKIVDAFEKDKTLKVVQTKPYPFEIMGISLLIEENDTETGM